MDNFFDRLKRKTAPVGVKAVVHTKEIMKDSLYAIVERRYSCTGNLVYHDSRMNPSLCDIEVINI